MKKTLPLAPPFLNPRGEQCISPKFCNPRPQNRFEIPLFLCLLLSHGYVHARNYGSFFLNWNRWHQIPDFTGLVDGEAKLALTNASSPAKAMIATIPPPLRGRYNSKSRFLRTKSNSNRRLGLLRLLHCLTLFFLKILGGAIFIGRLKILQPILTRIEKWGDSSPIWCSYDRPRTMAPSRLSLSFPLSTTVYPLFCVNVCLVYAYKLHSAIWFQAPTLNLRPSLHLLLFYTFCCCGIANYRIKISPAWRSLINMENGKRSYKKVLCSDIPFSKEQSTREPSKEHDDISTTRVNATLKGSSSTKPLEVNAPKKPFEASSSGTKKGKGKSKPKIDMVAFLGKLSGVKENIIHLKETSLYAFVLGDPLEVSRLRTKLRGDWKIKGDFFVHVRTHGWFELRFANPMERNRVWEGRPYHVFSQLVILRPWKSNFDTSSESISQVDVWVRIPRMPMEYLSFDILSTIMEWNNMGRVIKLDTYTEKKQRLRYARMCVNVDLASIEATKIVVPDENTQEHEYKVWFEDFPKGCGTCGEFSHTAQNCPLNETRNQAVTVTLPKSFSSKKKDTHPDPSSGLNDEAKWEYVGRTRPSGAETDKAPLEESETVLKSGIHVIYRTESSSSGSKGSKQSNCSITPSMVQEKTTSVMDPQDNTYEDQATQSEVSHLPNDDKITASQMASPLDSSTLQDKEEEENALDMVNEFLMSDEGDEQEGEFTQEELEAFIDEEFEEIDTMEDSQPLESYHSLSNTESVVLRLENLEVLPAQNSKSESSKRKGSPVGEASVTSVLKGGDNKRIKK